MNATLPEIRAERTLRQFLITATATILLASSFGLCAGFLDIGVLVFKKYCWNSEGHFRSARDFPWTVPVGHAVLMIIPGVAVAAVNRCRPYPISTRATCWIFGTLAIWSALLRMPLYGQCSLLLAVGLGRVISDAIAAHRFRPRQTRLIFAALLGVVGVLAALSSGWHLVREYRTVVGLPPAPPGARNVVLIVWDTVRAYNLGLGGYPRATTPNLRRWARQGVTYTQALSPAPWTFPSHTSFLTGHWPFRLNSQWQFTLDAPCVTLAEHLASSGYQTAGFVANTNCCSYEFGLDRGFAHYEDYSLTPLSLLGRTVPGNWLLTNIISNGDYYMRKWVGLQSRGAREIDGAVLNWLSRRRPDRPFFAFMNYFDAHEPYIPPRGYEGRFGVQPNIPRDYQFLVDYVGLEDVSVRDVLMARDRYDDCIAFLDEQLGRLLDNLQSQGLLENTDVIITSDHGEAFGDHCTRGHSYGLLLDEIGVPLVILSPAAPAGRIVESPVSLRDLPATVVDLLGVTADSPFPGRSLSVYWKLPPGEAPSGLTSPAFSEQVNASALENQPESDRKHRPIQMSLVAMGHHYVRNGKGEEVLFDLRIDPFERTNLMTIASGKDEVAAFRKMLLDILNDNLGSFEVESAYLATYRRSLEDDVRERSSPPLAVRD